jgi:hypothetical protein
MPTRNIELEHVWRAIREQTQERPQQATATVLASILGITATTWHKWGERARYRLVDAVGAVRARRLCPDWPPGAFERGAEGRAST